MRPTAHLLFLAALGAFFLAETAGFAQGSLTPSGAPAPTMLSLSQMQPRTPITSLPYTINAGGSYYLAGNLVGVSGQNGISINANNVTLDLNGFTLNGVASSLNGIAVSSPCLNLAIYNGGVVGWGNSGISASNAAAGRFENLRLLNNSAEGLIVGSNSFAYHCQASGNHGSGIRVAGAGNRLEENQSTANAGLGFLVDGSANLVIKNSAAANAMPDYQFAANNSYGELIQIPAGAFTNSTAWANFYVSLCSPLTCASLAANCGTLTNGCGGTLNCGTCPSPQACSNNQCVAVSCVPMTCAQQGFNCGSATDGCGGTLNCGTCPSPQVCSSNQCVAVSCVPKTCAQQGFNCGSATDGCGNVINCGTCTTPQTCGGGGVGNVCGTGTCVPKTCTQLGLNCGPAPDGCGNLIQCGSCPVGHTCVSGVCQ